MKKQERFRNVRRSWFTLVEMAAVAGIFAILLAMAVSATMRMSPQARLRRAVSLTNSELNLARGKAIGLQRKVALVMPSAHARVNGDLLSIGHRAMRLAYVNADNSFKSWVEDEDWTYLPGSAIFWSETLTPLTNVPADYQAPMSNSDFVGVIFNAHGGVLSGNNTYIYLLPGTTDEDGEAIFEKTDFDPESDNANSGLFAMQWYGIRILPFTGKMTTRYFGGDRTPEGDKDVRNW